MQGEDNETRFCFIDPDPACVEYSPGHRKTLLGLAQPTWRARFHEQPEIMRDTELPNLLDSGLAVCRDCLVRPGHRNESAATVPTVTRRNVTSPITIALASRSQWYAVSIVIRCRSSNSGVRVAMSNTHSLLQPAESMAACYRPVGGAGVAR